jgi:peroxiredoxin
VFLIIIGVLVASGSLQSLSATLSQGQFAETAINLEEQILGAVIGQESERVEPVENNDLILTNPDTAQVAPTEALENALPMPGAVENTPAAIGSITGIAAHSGPSVGIAVGNIAPDFETTRDTGEPLRLSDHRGEIVLLNFWATWCGPCRIEMPEFETAYQARKDAGFTIIAVNNGQPAAVVQEFRDELGVSFPLAMDERGSIQVDYNIFSYPSTFVLDRDGTILARHYGPLTAAQINELVENALAA